MTRLAFARAARGDLADIIAYIAMDSPSAAETLFRGIIDAAQPLVRFPAMGRAGRIPGTRELIVVGTSYMLVYTVTTDAVVIVAVFHMARDLTRALAERRLDPTE